MDSSPDSTLEQRIYDAIVRALEMRMGVSSTQLRAGSTPGWDSLGHIKIIIELEKEFQVTFPLELVPELQDVGHIAKAMERLQTNRLLEGDDRERVR